METYSVQNGDTLESVAKKLGISAAALRYYHNAYCELEDLIEEDINGIKKVFIPPSDKITVFKEAEKTITVSNQLPSVYLTESFYAPDYEVTEQLEQQDQDNITISYILSVQLRKIVGKGFEAAVKTSGFNRNGQPADDKISQLSQACMESISPISFLVPVQGRIKALYDHKAIVSKFENKRPDLESFFIGTIAEAYFNSFYTSLKNEGYLLKQFRSTLLYQVVFLELDWLRRKNEWEDNFYFAVDSFPVKCRFRTEYNHDHPDYTEITISGNSMDNVSLQELLNGVTLEEIPEDNATGAIEIKYTTHKVTKQLLRADATLILEYEGEVYSKHIITLTGKNKENG